MNEQHTFRKQFKFGSGVIAVSILSDADGLCAAPHIELTFYDTTQQITSKGLNTLKAAVVQAKDYEFKLNCVLHSLGEA